MVKKIIERTEYDITSDKIPKKDQRFCEKILPKSIDEGQTLDWFADMMNLLERKYGKYWRNIEIADIRMERDGTISIDLDCSR